MKKQRLSKSTVNAFSAGIALRGGYKNQERNGEIVAQYLREADPVDPEIIKMIAEMLDSKPGRFGYRLKIVARRGKPKTFNWIPIALRVFAVLGNPPNVEAAVKQVTMETGLGRATVYRHWREFRSRYKTQAEQAKYAHSQRLRFRPPPIIVG
jgi:hypothetical protein